MQMSVISDKVMVSSMALCRGADDAASVSQLLLVTLVVRGYCVDRLLPCIRPTTTTNDDDSAAAEQVRESASASAPLLARCPLPGHGLTRCLAAAAAAAAAATAVN